MEANISPFISIVVGFRDRELGRIKNALASLERQSYKNFELVFVDYGSEEEIKEQSKHLVESFAFANYTYANTKGWFWNRADALNIGIKKAKGDVLLTYDIDLIIEDDFLIKISALNYHTHFYTFSCFYLPQHFDPQNHNLIVDGIHYEQNYVGLLAVKRQFVDDLRGFDEYYMVWGGEDDDLYQGLLLAGLKRKQMAASEFMVFHQWHHKESPVKPTMWYLAMVNYLYKSNRRNFKEQIALNKERPLLKLLDDKSYMQSRRLEFLMDQKFLFFNSFIQDFMELSTGEIAYLEYEFPKPKNKVLTSKLFKKRFVQNAKIDLKDIIAFFEYFIGVNRYHLSDYYLGSNQEKVLFLCQKR